MNDHATDPAELAASEIGMGPPKLEKIVEPAALAETAASVTELFGVAVRIYSASAGQLAGGPLEAAVLSHAESLARGARPPLDVRGEAGGRYRLLPVEYDGRSVGSVVLGPYAFDLDAPHSSAAAARRFDDAASGGQQGYASAAPASELRPSSAAGKGPVIQPKKIDDLCRHITRLLDLVMWSGHKALLTSTMHLASMRESYRELSDKNAKLNETYERLKELDKLKSNFIATVSHELRTPLTSIMGYSEMLAEGIAGPLNAEQTEFIATIRTKSDQLLGLIVSLLDMSKLESGTFFVRPRPVLIVALLTDVVATLTPTANKKGVRLSVEGEDDPARAVRGDADRLRQVFLNLTENAVKFTPPGGRVTLSAAEGIDPRDHEGVVLVAPLHRAVEVRVADTGVGIPRAERDRVFAPFYQVDQSSTREQGGTGLGLAIVTRLVDAHHGSIRIEDNEPRGTVFVVTLPVADEDTPVSTVDVEDSLSGATSSQDIPPVFQ